MSRWYQNVLTGAQVEVKTLKEDDFYQENSANWARIAAPTPTESTPEPQPPVERQPPVEPEPDQPKRHKRA